MKGLYVGRVFGRDYFYGVIPAKLFLGIASLGDQMTGLYACLSVQYEQADEAKALAVASALDRQGLAPVVYLTEYEARPYVAALFQPRLDAELFHQVVPVELHDRLRRLSIKNLVMTAESDFDGEVVEIFLTLFRKHGSFRLQIVDRVGEGTFQSKWHRVLRSLDESWPQLAK